MVLPLQVDLRRGSSHEFMDFRNIAIYHVLKLAFRSSPIKPAMHENINCCPEILVIDLMTKGEWCK